MGLCRDRIRLARQFLFLILIIILIPSVLAASSSPYHNYVIEPACDTSTSVFLPWTGFRISRQTTTNTLTAQETHMMRLSYCWKGVEYAHALSEGELERTQWLQWNTTFCINALDSEVAQVRDISGCYRIARRNDYIVYETPLIRPDTFIGGIFACKRKERRGSQNILNEDISEDDQEEEDFDDEIEEDREDDDANFTDIEPALHGYMTRRNVALRTKLNVKVAFNDELLAIRKEEYSCEDNQHMIPIAPLLYDEPYMIWHEGFGNYSEVIPFLYTPDRPSLFYPRLDTTWSQYIDINENYDPGSLPELSKLTNILTAVRIAKDPKHINELFISTVRRGPIESARKMLDYWLSVTAEPNATLRPTSVGRE